MGIGKMGQIIGETGVGEMGVGEMGVIRSERLLKWFSSYLSDRRHRVVINGQASGWTYIKAGGPQGSILGPLLFLIYINDINMSCMRLSDFFLTAPVYIWTASSEFGAYRICEQRRFRRACASAQSRQNLRYSLIQAVSQEEPSDRKRDPWPL